MRVSSTARRPMTGHLRGRRIVLSLCAVSKSSRRIHQRRQTNITQSANWTERGQRRLSRTNATCTRRRRNLICQSDSLSPPPRPHLIRRRPTQTVDRPLSDVTAELVRQIVELTEPSADRRPDRTAASAKQGLNATSSDRRRYRGRP